MTAFSDSESASAVKLHKAGLELVSLVEDEPYYRDFGDAQITVSRTDLDLGSAREIYFDAIAILKSTAIGGFGAMIGKAEELLAIFPDEAKFEMNIDMGDGYKGAWVQMSSTDRSSDARTKFWGGSQIDSDDENNVIIFCPSFPARSFSAEERLAMSNLDEKAVLASAGSYVASLADRAHTLMLADRQ